MSELDRLKLAVKVAEQGERLEESREKMHKEQAELKKAKARAILDDKDPEKVTRKAFTDAVEVYDKESDKMVALRSEYRVKYGPEHTGPNDGVATPETLTVSTGVHSG